MKGCCLLLDENPTDIWIGASDSEEESVFKRESDNTVLTYSNWDRYEPNSGRQKYEEDCVDMVYDAANK